MDLPDKIDDLNHISDGRILVSKDALLALKEKWEIEAYKTGYIAGCIDQLNKKESK